ncbi:MAG: homoserine kinase [bacterium]
MIRVRVPASTSNLGSGFDCFGLALQLYLTVQMETTGRDLQIHVAGEGCGEIPTNADNLIYKAFRLVFEKSPKSVPPVRIEIVNEIPLFRGLGSSGAAAIAGLVTGAKVAGINLNDCELLNLANQIEGHPENAAASLYGGLTINCVENESVLTQKVPVSEKLKAVLFIPHRRISTEQARKVLPRTISHKDAVFNLQRSALLAHAFLTADFRFLNFAVQDKIHQPFRKKLIPGFDEIEQAGYDAGALAVCISGSGSTVLGLCTKETAQLTAQWQALANKLQISAQILTVGIDPKGVSFLN